jgi:hypothetical protein
MHRTQPPVVLHCLQPSVFRGAYRGAGSSYLQQLLRVEALPPGCDQLQDLHLPLSADTTHHPAASNDNGHPSHHQQQQQQQQGGGNAAAGASGLRGLLADSGEGGAAGDDDVQLALAVQAIAEAAQLGVGSAEQLYPQTLDEYYAACEEEQPWKVAL